MADTTPPAQGEEMPNMAADDATDSGNTIRAVVRALALLRTMNSRQSWSLHALHQATGLAKSTLFRLLATLQEEGYVRTEAKTGAYRLTPQVRELGAGVTEQSLLVEKGGPIALKVTKQIKWPLAIGLPEGDVIVVRYSTMPYSPLAPHTTTLGHRLGLLETAMGRIYLAFCSSNERESFLERMTDLMPANAQWSGREMLQELEVLRRTGYAVRQPNQTRGTATMAVPILHDSAAIAALSMTTFGKSLTTATIEKYLPVLQETAREIAVAYGDVTTHRAKPAARKVTASNSSSWEG